MGLGVQDKESVTKDGQECKNTPGMTDNQLILKSLFNWQFPAACPWGSKIEEPRQLWRGSSKDINTIF
jgi:hypothetical protein